MGFTLQSFAPSGESERRFPSLLSALALSRATSRASRRCFSGLLLPKKPSPYLRPHRLSKVGSACSPGPFDLSGLLSNDACTEMSLLCTAPLVLMSPASHKVEDPEPQGIRPSFHWHFLRRGAYPYGLSHHLHPLPFKKIRSLRTIFSSPDPRYFAVPSDAFFAANCLLPNRR